MPIAARVHPPAVHRLSCRVTAAELALFRAAAEREGLELGDWLRAAAGLAMARGSTR